LDATVTPSRKNAAVTTLWTAALPLVGVALGSQLTFLAGRRASLIARREDVYAPLLAAARSEIARIAKLLTEWRFTASGPEPPRIDTNRAGVMEALADAELFASKGIGSAASDLTVWLMFVDIVLQGYPVDLPVDGRLISRDYVALLKGGDRQGLTSAIGDDGQALLERLRRTMRKEIKSRR
jgi:hypothetical protein